MILAIVTTQQTRVRVAPKPWRNVLYNWQGFLVTAAVSFFLSPFIVHHLGNVEYGTWILLASVVGYMALLDLGIRGAVTRYVANFHATGDHHRSNSITSAALLILTAAGFSAIFASLIIALFAVPTFNIPPALIPTAQIVVILGGLTIAVSLVNGVLEAAIVGLQRFDYGSYLDIASELTRALSIVIALRLGAGLLALAVIQLVVAISRGMTAYAISAKIYPELNVLKVRWEKQSMRLISAFSIYAVLLMAASRINTFTDPIVIGSFLPVEFATFFAIASSLTTYGRSIITGITFTLIPQLSALESQGRSREELQVVILKASRFASLAIIPVVTTFIFRGGTFIGLWMGQQYVAQSGHVLWILAIALWADVGLLTVHATTLGLSKHRGLVPFYLIEAALNLGLSIWLVQRVGIIGVAWGTTIPRLLNALVCGPWYLHRSLRISAIRFFVNTWLIPAIAMIPFAVATLLIDKAWHAHNLMTYFIQIGAIYPLAIIGAWCSGLTTAERHSYRILIRDRAVRMIHGG